MSPWAGPERKDTPLLFLQILRFRLVRVSSIFSHTITLKIFLDSRRASGVQSTNPKIVCEMVCTCADRLFGGAVVQCIAPQNNAWHTVGTQDISEGVGKGGRQAGGLSDSQRDL